MLAKNGALSFDVNAQTKRPINAAIQFSTQDINTARLSFKITKDGAPLPLSAVVGKLAMTMADGSRFIKDVTLVDKTEGLAEYVLTAEEIRHYGAVKAELLLRYTNGQALSIHKFGYEIDRSLIDQDIVPIAEYYIEDFEALKTRVSELYDSVVATVRELEDKFADLDNVETKDGAQSKVDAHANNTDIHVTTQKKTEWDAKETPTGAQTKVDAHAGVKDIHTTVAEKGVWNNSQLSKITADNGIPLIYVRDVNESILEKIIDNGLGMGTFYAVTNSKDLPPASRSIRGTYHMTDASNGKGTFGWVYATDFANVAYHNYLNNGSWRGWRQVLTDVDAVTEAEKSVWNGGQLYKITQDSGERKTVPSVLNGTDVLSLPTGNYSSAGQYLTNMPTTSDSSYYNISVDSSGTRKDIRVSRSFDNTHWFGTVHTGGVFKGWKRVLTDDELSSTWNLVTFINGAAQHNSVYPLKFSIRQNALHLRGSFENIPPSETVIARFAQKPSSKATFGATTVGSYGSARLSLTEDGSLKFDGMLANDASKVNRIEINESIPLW